MKIGKRVNLEYVQKNEDSFDKRSTNLVPDVVSLSFMCVSIGWIIFMTCVEVIVH